MHAAVSQCDQAARGGSEIGGAAPRAFADVCVIMSGGVGTPPRGTLELKQDFSLSSTSCKMVGKPKPSMVRNIAATQWNPSQVDVARGEENEFDFTLSCTTEEACPGTVVSPITTEEQALRLALMTQQQQPTLRLTGSAAKAGLVEYISEVVQDFGLSRSTVGLAVTYYDSFVFHSSGQHDSQLVSLTCTRLAAKFSEMQMPAVEDLCELARTTRGCIELSEPQVTAMEVEILRVLKWQLNVVTAWTALAQLEVIFCDEVEAFQQAELFVELSYYEPRLSSFEPLVVAAAAVLCACIHLGRKEQARLFLQQRLCEVCAVRDDELMRCRLVLQGCLESAMETTVNAAVMLLGKRL